jgi:Flp pilus assembly pilin Flp
MPSPRHASTEGHRRCNDRGATAVEYGHMVALKLPSWVSSRSPARNRLSTLFDTVATSV